MAETDKFVVTGGTSGFGLRLADILANDGSIGVVLTGRSLADAEAVARRLGAHGMALDLGSLKSGVRSQRRCRH